MQAYSKPEREQQLKEKILCLNLEKTVDIMIIILSVWTNVYESVPLWHVGGGKQRWIC